MDSIFVFDFWVWCREQSLNSEEMNNGQSPDSVKTYADCGTNKTGGPIGLKVCVCVCEKVTGIGEKNREFR